MQRSLLRSLMISGVALFATAGIVAAASTRDVTGLLGGKTGDYFDLNGTLLVDSIKVGAQGVGGVTYFNGTIVNSTTGSNNTGNPIAIGDDLRVDGTLFRGGTQGPGDNLPLKLNDDANLYGNLTMSGGKTLDVTGVTLSGLSSDDLSDVSSIAKLGEAEIITADWVNTANPWAANEIADTTRKLILPLTSFLTDADGVPAQLSATSQPNLLYTANQGLFLQYSEDDTADVGTQFVVPDDYVSGGVFKMVVDTSAAIVTDWDMDFKVAVSQTTGSNNAWDVDMDNETAVNISDTPGKPRVLTFTPTDQSDLSASDTVFVDFFPANNTGAGEPDVEIYNAWFEYTASQ